MAGISEGISALRALLRGTSGRNTFLSAFEAVALAFLQFAAYLILVRIAAPEAVSLWVLVNSLLSVARAADFSAQGLVSFVAEARSKGEEGTAHSYITTSIIMGSAGYSLLAACGCAVLYFALPLMVDAQQASAVRPHLPLFGVVFALSSLAGIYKLAFLGLERVGPKVVQTVGGMVVFIAASIVFAPSWGLTGILFAQLIQALASLLYAMFWYHQGRVHTSFAQYWSSSIARTILVYGLQSMTVGWVQLTIEPVIRMLANHFGGLNSVLLVELASRSIMAVRSLLLSAGQVLIPKYSASLDSDRQKLGTSILHAEEFYFSLGAPVLMLTVISAPILAGLAAHIDAKQLTVIAAILAFTWFFNIISAPTYFLLVGQRRVKALFLVHVIMTGGSVVFGLLGGITFGIYGALAGTSAAFLLSCLAQMRSGRDVTLGADGRSRRVLLQAPALASLLMVVLSGAALSRQLGQETMSLAWWVWGLLSLVAPSVLGLHVAWKSLSQKRRAANLP